jgi:hypothetical protein
MAGVSGRIDLLAKLSLSGAPVGGGVSGANIQMEHSIEFAPEIMAILIRAEAANTNNVVFGPAASNGFIGPFNAAADRLKVEPGEMVILTSVRGWAVTAATADLLTVLNGAAGTSVSYEIVVVGRTIVG